MVTDEHEWKTNEARIDVDVVFGSSKVEDCPQIKTISED